jgi:hypothetical protein
LALALAGVALATGAFTQVSSITLTGHHPGATTGIKASVYSSDLQAPGGKPKAAKTLVVTFPTGTRFNFGSIKPCNLSDSQLEKANAKGCPAASQIGTGSAIANTAPSLLGNVTAQVTSYVHNSKDVILWVHHARAHGVAGDVNTPLVIHEKVSGSKLTIPVPTQKVGPITVVLTKLTLSVPQHGSGSHALITAGKCTDGQFVVKSHFNYVDGSTFDATSSSKCS